MLLEKKTFRRERRRWRQQIRNAAATHEVRGSLIQDRASDPRLLELIMRHSNEARTAKNNFRELPSRSREKLLTFLSSL